MGLLLLGLLYAFGAACFVNYFVMFARIRTTEKYIERREKLLAAHEALHGPVTAETESATPPPPPPPLLLRAEPLRVVFLHPDLGIGGAERLIVDAAVGLQRCQSIQPVEVTIVTNHHDPTRAFAETTNGMVRVVVRGSRLPASILGRAKVLCATLRMGFAAFATCWAFPDTDCFVVDQVAAAMPVLNICAGKTPILFYSHFPDQLCNSNRNADGTFKTSSGSASAAHETYRGLFDQVEASSMNFATSIVCNSKFSRQVSVDTFPALAERIREDADIFYPPVEMKVREVTASALAESAPLRELHAAVRDAVTFVSINRYERKKNVALAIEAFARVLAMGEFKAAEGRRPLMLVVAGGCDPRQEENVQHADELVALATGKLQIPASQVRFLKNITDEEKAVLLSEMRALVYTPSREHFGIVPVEAMAYAKPVVAIADGGPCESVGDVEHEDPALCGGLLSSPEPSEFAEKMACFARDADYAAKVGAQGRARVVEKFSMETFSTQLATRLVELRAAADNKLLAEGIEFAKKEAASKAGKAAAKEKRE
ncbi:dolichyl-P-Man:GDP-Man1GlcNAc2-PP-dolichyl alpha-1,3-mannosyltransferase [Novymonas esmeraldas]|uniref:Alpha-1,3/1,6-mannosyltransferase ALG2 n=1 Tax=Novymonas esmeraldas TaxID=1808958 RepID=A0AAW0F6C7_9TRYP